MEGKREREKKNGREIHTKENIWKNSEEGIREGKNTRTRAQNIPFDQGSSWNTDNV